MNKSPNNSIFSGDNNKEVSDTKASDIPNNLKNLETTISNF